MSKNPDPVPDAPETNSTPAADVTAHDADAPASGARAEKRKAKSKADDDADDDAEPDAGRPARKPTRYLNTTGSPVVYDTEGHSVDAASWIELSGLDVVGKHARSQGYLMPQSAL